MTLKSIRTVLLVEDNPGDARLLREMLDDEGSHETVLTLAASMSEAEAYLAEHSVDIILLDLGLPDAQGLAAVRRTHSVAPKVPLVVLTGMDDERLAARALQEGAQDYLIKGQIVPTSSQTETRGLLRAMRYAIERKTMDEALYLERERAQVTLNSIGDAVICTDIEGSVTFLNVLAEGLTGWTRERGDRPAPFAKSFVFSTAWIPRRSSDPRQVLIRPQRDMRAPSNRILVRRDASEIPIEDSIAPIYDREGNAVGSVIVFRDVSAARAMALQMTHSAEHDFLTGLPNRMLLNDRIGQAIAAAPRHNKQVAVLFLDLDGFKHINDSLGHPIGDKLLQSVAKRLVGMRAKLRHGESAGRRRICRAPFEPVNPTMPQCSKTHAGVGRRGPSWSIEHDLHITTSIGVSVVSRRRTRRGDTHQERGYGNVPGEGKRSPETTSSSSRP